MFKTFTRLVSADGNFDVTYMGKQCLMIAPLKSKLVHTITDNAKPGRVLSWVPSKAFAQMLAMKDIQIIAPDEVKTELSDDEILSELGVA